jgi:uncharacterized membrane protein YeaQ/YmgE (transglycosylase-associated protein family)
MFSLLIWIVFGLIVGLIAKAIHPSGAPIGCLSTIAIGVGGSFVGGGINYILGFGNHPFAPSGFLMSILGGILYCIAWRWYTLKTDPTGPKSFFSGKHLR